MIDTYKHKGLRKQLVINLQQKGISNKAVLDAIGKIKRHCFVESFLELKAYEDMALPIAAKQTISQPYTVAFQTQLLEIKAGDKILEIGTGSGYQTAVLLEMKAKVFTIERQKELFAKAGNILSKLQYKPQRFFGDGYKGKPTYGPYDKILITAGIPKMTDSLLKQLKIGGKLVAPIGVNDNQVMTVFDRLTEKEFQQQKYGDFLFVPMLKGVNK